MERTQGHCATLSAPGARKRGQNSVISGRACREVRAFSRHRGGLALPRVYLVVGVGQAPRDPVESRCAEGQPKSSWGAWVVRWAQVHEIICCQDSPEKGQRAWCSLSLQREKITQGPASQDQNSTLVSQWGLFLLCYVGRLTPSQAD